MPSAQLLRKDFQLLAELRVKEARVLLANGRELGAYYLCGYAVECALKACIAKTTKRSQFPPKPDTVRKMYTHNLLDLAELAGLKNQLDRTANTRLAANWAIVKDWTEQSRYVRSGLNGTDMYEAVTGADGVFPWIKTHW